MRDYNIERTPEDRTTLIDRIWFILIDAKPAALKLSDLMTLIDDPGIMKLIQEESALIIKAFYQKVRPTPVDPEIKELRLALDDLLYAMGCREMYYAHIQDEMWAYRRALCSLTPGGSEYIRPDDCVKVIREIRTTHHEIIKRRTRDTHDWQDRCEKLELENRDLKAQIESMNESKNESDPEVEVEVAAR